MPSERRGRRGLYDPRCCPHRGGHERAGLGRRRRGGELFARTVVHIRESTGGGKGGRVGNRSKVLVSVLCKALIKAFLITVSCMCGGAMI